MQSWEEWLDVQNGANLSARENYEKKAGRRFIATPRDLATYVHYDALYEAYLNACLILLGNEAPFDPGIPFQLDDALDHQQGFAHFGGPHILSLVTEVATRALKAVRYQKFNVHRRLRPEALGGRLSKHKELDVAELSRMARTLKPILTRVQARNAQALSDAGETNSLGKQNFLLPMAFCEGSPMHPAYGAGHATVAGACVTILKAFFDHHQPLAMAIPKGGKEASADTAYVPKLNKSTQDATLEPKPVLDRDGNPAQLTVEGELNKLASNISIGRDWAGVHYFTDAHRDRHPPGAEADLRRELLDDRAALRRRRGAHLSARPFSAGYRHRKFPREHPRGRRPLGRRPCVLVRGERALPGFGYADPMNAVAAQESAEPTAGKSRWALRLGLVALALWGPFLASLPFLHRMRRSVEDLWLWPGLVPGYLISDDLYDEGVCALVTFGHLAIAGLLARWSLPAGMAWALFFALASWARLQALLAI
jgi:hypothetical protein